MTSGWDDHAVVEVYDTDGAPLEDQLAVLVRKVEIHLAEQAWEAQEQERRQHLRKERGVEIRAAAVEKARDERNAAQAR